MPTAWFARQSIQPQPAARRPSKKYSQCQPVSPQNRDIEPGVVLDSDESEKAKPSSSPLPAPAPALRFSMSLAAAQASSTGCSAEGRCPSLTLLPPTRQCLGQPIGNPVHTLGKTGTTSSPETPPHQVRFVSASPLQAQETNAGLHLVPLPSRHYLFSPASVLHLAGTTLCL